MTPRIPRLLSEERRKVVISKFYDVPINKLCREELFAAIYDLMTRLAHSIENNRENFKAIQVLEKELAKYRLKKKS